MRLTENKGEVMKKLTDDEVMELIDVFVDEARKASSELEEEIGVELWEEQAPGVMMDYRRTLNNLEQALNHYLQIKDD